MSSDAVYIIRVSLQLSQHNQHISLAKLPLAQPGCVAVVSLAPRQRVHQSIIAPVTVSPPKLDWRPGLCIQSAEICKLSGCKYGWMRMDSKIFKECFALVDNSN